MRQVMRLGWIILGAAAMAISACGPAPYVEDARAARDADEAVPAAAPPPPVVVAPAAPVAPPTIIVVQCPAASPCPAAAPPPPVVVAPPPPAAPVDPAVVAAFERRMPKMLKCYRKALRRNPTLAGSVVVRLDVDEDGDVDEARDHGSTLGDRDAIDCVIDQAEGLDFKRFVGTRIIYPIYFHPGMRG
ncbi:MAG: AgmX/PglI C-terminal domain-containing protein [Polyangiaceae bacterium]|nr:AgmX/PglI C-terminal domain-containing protein [Polyangiaceae bacterium]